MRTHLRPLIAAASLMALASAVTGCTAPPFITSESCVSWVSFETPQEAAADAAAVVVGRVVARDGSAPMFGVDAHAWAVEVDAWVAGTEREGPVRVVSTPVTCTGGDDYPDGDPLDTDADVMLFLFEQEGTLSLVTPLQGVIPAPPDGRVPTEWPAE